MRVAVLQHDIVWEDPPANFARLAPRIADAAAEARLVVLTEMFATGFSMDTDRIAEPPGGPTTTFLADQARAHRVWVCGSVPERAAGDTRPANCLVLAGPDGEMHRYRKIHPFGSGGEHEHYAAGSEHVTVTVDGVSMSLFVCYDLRFADEFWALAERTDAYVVVANWPAARRDHWIALLRARAIENQAYVIAANRVGRGGGLDYAGDSAIIDPFGAVIVEAGDREAAIAADVEPGVVAEIRSRYPFLADRRPAGTMPG